MNKKLFIFFIATVLFIGVFALTSVIVTTKNDAAPKVIIGHAVSDEKGNLNGGEAGDQSGNEVVTRKWYAGWTVVFRAKDINKADAIAAAMEQACANDNIGYDQYERTSLYKQAKKNGWHLAEITAVCETDCSALVAVCVNAAGIQISKDCYTGNLQKNLMDTDAFEAFTDSAFTDSTEFLQRGDILLKNGHTAVVLITENDNE